ncbi:MAG TPA: hypothetical protein PLK02_06905 [Paludibacteraceae bacterium]|nr:hypothetical protein [Paludibacteraceae bacterium]
MNKFVKEIKCPHCGAVDITTGIALNSFAKKNAQTFGHCYECLKDFKVSYEAVRYNKTVRYDKIGQDNILLEYSVTAMANPGFKTVTKSYNPVTGEYETAVTEYRVTSIDIWDYPDIY